MRRVLRSSQRLWVISALLVALVVRALIPAGFMPATDRPFSFQICPDGFPAALLQTPATGGAENGQAWHHHEVGTLADAGHHHDEGALAHAGHHHDGSAPAQAGHHHDDGALAHAGHHHDDGVLAHAGHHHEDGALAHAGHHHDAGALAQTGSHHDTDNGFGHHHDGPAHQHGSVSAEHCVFAAAAGAFAFAFAATFSTPATSLGAPDAPYVSPAIESRRFRIPQPRGPPTLS